MNPRCQSAERNRNGQNRPRKGSKPKLFLLVHLGTIPQLFTKKKKFPLHNSFQTARFLFTIFIAFLWWPLLNKYIFLSRQNIGLFERCDQTNPLKSNYLYIGWIRKGGALDFSLRKYAFQKKLTKKSFFLYIHI